MNAILGGAPTMEEDFSKTDATVVVGVNHHWMKIPNLVINYQVFIDDLSAQKAGSPLLAAVKSCGCPTVSTKHSDIIVEGWKDAKVYDSGMLAIFWVVNAFQKASVYLCGFDGRYGAQGINPRHVLLMRWRLFLDALGGKNLNRIHFYNPFVSIP